MSSSRHLGPRGVWYDSALETDEGIAPARGFPPAGQITEGQGTGQPGGSQGGGLPPNVTTDWERSSRVARTKVSEFTYVYVILDQGRLQGMTRGQLADYVAMVGLAQIRPGARVSDAPTILKLFDDAPQAALPHMSEWDHAFLKSLYMNPADSQGAARRDRDEDGARNCSLKRPRSLTVQNLRVWRSGASSFAGVRPLSCRGELHEIPIPSASSPAHFRNFRYGTTGASG